ncbi:MAG: FAD-dependent oxidoreductase [Burkholderiaceae bacterium]
MKIAVIGSGISGLACAWRLSTEHEVTLYESQGYLGGHTHTVDATVDGTTYPVDTGFLVFNERTYPTLIDLFARLKIPTAAAEMSFSVTFLKQGERALEWAGTNLNSVFAQRRNLAKPSFLTMLRDIVRFNAVASRLALEPVPNGDARTLGEFLKAERYSKAFQDWYLLPMAAAIWSCSLAQMSRYPLMSFVRFCHNHGLLQIAHRPQWYTVRGGAREYVKKLAQGISSIRLGEGASRIERNEALGRVMVASPSGTAAYHRAVLACHPDQSLQLLADPSPVEALVLGAISYQPNRAVLHTDQTVLPKQRRAWAAWNYQCQSGGTESDTRATCVHYLINRLQPIPFKRPVIVSLNPFREPRPETVIGRYDYRHPVFDDAALDAQRHLAQLQGQRNTWFAGAWTGYGFHEDGLKSGLAAAEAILQSTAQPTALAA